MKKGPGLKPPQVGPLKREVIGPDECPIMHRWTLLDLGQRIGKLLVHHFLPNADDRAVHDHPRPFVTLVLRGGYEDLVPCTYPGCGGDGALRVTLPHPPDATREERRQLKRVTYPPCPRCAHVPGSRGLMVGDRMHSGSVRYRPAEHQHRTRVGPDGCWTVVVMGPLARACGFIVDGEWMPWREHERRFGFGMRCGDEAES